MGEGNAENQKTAICTKEKSRRKKKIMFLPIWSLGLIVAFITLMAWSFVYLLEQKADIDQIIEEISKIMSDGLGMNVGKCVKFCLLICDYVNDYDILLLLYLSILGMLLTMRSCFCRRLHVVIGTLVGGINDACALFAFVLMWGHLILAPASNFNELVYLNFLVQFSLFTSVSVKCIVWILKRPQGNVYEVIV